jgi:hypothetical protein
LARVVGNPELALEMGRRASSWAQGYSLEALKAAIRRVLESSWDVKLNGVLPAEIGCPDIAL